MRIALSSRFLQFAYLAGIACSTGSPLAQTQGPESIQLSTLVRDFISKNNPSNIQPFHPHFNSDYDANCVGQSVAGMTTNTLAVTTGDTTLGDNRNPVLSPTPPTTVCMVPPNRFNEWFTDVPGINRKFKVDLTFTRNAQGQYVWDNQAFFPLDPGGPYTKFNAADPNPWNDLFPSAGNHNFGFTLELHTEFTYIPGQTFTFTGDDDVFVFVNGQLMMDIGGIHSAITRSFTLDEPTATRLGMVPNRRYKLDFFFAERHITDSRARITTSIPLNQPTVNESITFVDSTGRPLAFDEIYEPTNRFLFIRYIDENPINPALRTKQLTLNIQNNFGLSPADMELISKTVTPTGDSAIWLFQIPLAEAINATQLNNIAESYVLGIAKASVVAHDANAVEIQPPITAQIRIAYKDKPLTITVTPCTGSGTIDRTTQCVEGKVTNQPLSKFPSDTLLVTFKCSATGDQVTVAARKTVTADGVATFVTDDLTKTEVVGTLTDGILTCKDADEIVATVTDPIFKELGSDTKTWTIAGPKTMHFALPSNPAASIVATGDGVEGNNVYLVIATSDPTANVVNQISATVKASTGETETMVLTETDANSGVFVVLIPFAFVIEASLPGNAKIEFILDPAKANNDANMVATYNFDGVPQSVTLNVASLFNKVVNAWVKDENQNGQADKVYFQFTKPLAAAPSGINPIHWNSAASPGVMPPAITLVAGSGGLIAVADFSTSEFPKGLTGSGNNPFAQFPATHVFGGQKPILQDSLGPIINTATIALFDPTKVLPGQTTVGEDTLTIVLSEPLKDAQYLRLLKYSTPDKAGQCSDGSSATTLQVKGQPSISADRLTMIFIIPQDGNATRALPGNCVYLTNDGQYVDLKSNIPAKIGTKLQGLPPRPKVEVFRGYPPVVGIDINSDPANPLTPQQISDRNLKFLVATNDPKNNDLFDYSSTVGGVTSVNWIPPADFAGNPSYLDNTGSQDHGYVPRGAPSNVVDQQKSSLLPSGISLVQVVTTTPYIADVAIFDNLGNHVVTFRQSFGYMGEFSNPERIHYKGFVSYLVWNLKDKKNQRVGQGVYIWKVTFTFDNRSQKVEFTRTGVVRPR